MSCARPGVARGCSAERRQMTLTCGQRLLSARRLAQGGLSAGTRAVASPRRDMPSPTACDAARTAHCATHHRCGEGEGETQRCTGRRQRAPPATQTIPPPPPPLRFPFSLKAREWRGLLIGGINSTNRFLSSAASPVDKIKATGLPVPV